MLFQNGLARKNSSGDLKFAACLLNTEQLYSLEFYSGFLLMGSECSIGIEDIRGEGNQRAFDCKFRSL